MLARIDLCGNGKWLAKCVGAEHHDALAPRRDIAQCFTVFFQVVSKTRVAENESEVAAVGANFFETECDLIGYNRCRSPLCLIADGGGTRATTETASLRDQGGARTNLRGRA